MVEFEVKSKKQTIGKKKGQTVYYAVPKSNQHMTLDSLCDMIMDETSLSRGDVMNTLITLGKMACRSLKMGASVDLGDLGSCLFPSKDDGQSERCNGCHAEETKDCLYS